MKNLITLVLFALVSIITTSSVKADVVSEYHLNLNITNDLSAQISLEVNLHNNATGSVIRAYSLDFPFTIVNAEAKLNGETVDISIDKLSDGSRINVTFFDKVINDNSDGRLDITLFADSPIVQNYDISQLLLPYPESNFSYQEVTANVTYPVLLGAPTLISEYKYNFTSLNSEQNQISLSQKNPLMIIWGTPKYNVGFDLTLRNLKDTSNHYLLGLVPEYKNQIVHYINVNTAEYALTDKLGNAFSYLKLERNSNIPINNSVNIEVNSDDSESAYPEKYNWNLNLDSTLGQKIYSQINQGTEVIGKLNALNDFLVSNFEVDDKRIDASSLDKIWENGTKSLNQLQFCYLIVSTAEYLGLPARINYGYSILNPGLQAGGHPSIWCEVLVDGRDISFDVPNQKLFKISYFNTSHIDKLRMGTWHPVQSYNDILGLLINNPYEITINPLAVKQGLETNVSMQLEFPEKVFSGEFYSGIIKIKNNSTKLLTFTELRLNGGSILNNIVVGDLTKAVMPLQENSLKVDYLRETDFILDKTISVNIEAELNKNISLKAQENVTFEPDYKLIAIFVVIILVVVFILLFLVSRLLKKKF